MTQIKIGPIDKVILFGGGALVVAFAKAARARGLQVVVFAVNRHLEEIVDEENRLTLALALEKASIPFFPSSDINAAQELAPLMDGKALGIGLGEAYTFNLETIAGFGGKLFDFMVIKLPQYRGGAHFTWQILREDPVGCWNIQAINEEMIPGVFDSGEVIKTRAYTLPPWVRIPADYFKVAHEEGIALFLNFLDEIQAEKVFDLRKLEDTDSSYFPRLSTINQAFIDWSWNAEEIVRFIAAFDDPYPGAMTFIEGRRVILKKSSLAPETFQSHPFLSGLIYRIEGSHVFIAAKTGAIRVEAVLDLDGADRIPDLRLGQRLYTPIKNLEAAMCYRANYDTEGLVNHD